MKYKTLNRLISPLVKIIWPSKIFGMENLKIDTNAIFVCNHYTTMDTNVLYAKIFKDDLNVLVKAEAFEKKFAAKFLSKIGGIPVRRGEADIIAMKEVFKRLKKGKSVLIYPEGTRNKTNIKEMLPLKTGAAWFALYEKLPIIPILYYKPARMFRKNYLIIGKPIYFNALYDKPTNDNKIVATQILYDEMKKLRIEIDTIVESRKVKIKHVKN